MIILGINSVFHDTTACIVRDGKLVVAIEQERLSRQKHTSAFPHEAIAECLKVAGITLADVDHIAVSFKPSLDIGKKLMFALSNPTSALAIFKLQILRFYWKYREVNNWYKRSFPTKKAQLHFVSHHESHVVGSFLVSPYEKAALLSLDGSGEWSTGYLGYGDGKKITEFDQIYYPHSLGSVYEAVTYFVGFKPAYDEGKTMGLAPYGNADTYFEQAKKVVTVDEAGKLTVDLSYFRFQYCKHDYLSDKFIETFGAPRRKGEEISQRHMDVAAAFQKVLEESGLSLCRFLREKTQADYLVIAGGVALNSVMNGRIVRESGFKDLYVMPAAGDNGTALGAAYCVYNKVLGQPRNFSHMNPYVGKHYTDDEVKKVLDECKLPYEHHDDIAVTAAQLLAEGNIIGWMQGATEIGPRALGNRSILADPTKDFMKDKVNAEVKHREAYRPFAPSVPVEHLAEYFDIEVEVPFMLKVCDVRPEKRNLLPAITHVDGSARVQSVTAQSNPRYHRLMTEFGKLSGVPVVLNTSFNIMGEPVIETPYDAIRCFFSTGLDHLIIGSYLIRKHPVA
jgi:carbamoyltransferase